MAEEMSESFARLQSNESDSFAELVDRTCVHTGASRFELWLNKDIWKTLKKSLQELRSQRAPNHAVHPLDSSVYTRQDHSIAPATQVQDASPQKAPIQAVTVTARHKALSANACKKTLHEVASARYKSSDEAQERHGGASKRRRDLASREVNAVEQDPATLRAQVTEHLLARMSGCDI